MILIVSSSQQEREALSAICSCRERVVVASQSVRSAARVIRKYAPRTVVIRHRLSDGYSDHVLSNLTAGRLATHSHRIVLLAAGSSSGVEAQQIALGADCVLRDPVRSEVLLAYIEKFQRTARSHPNGQPSTGAPLPFAGGLLHATERRLQCDHRFAALAPREVELIEMLLHDAGHLVTYETLYSEILNRRFAGDTSNMRVLLDKICRSAASVGIRLRDWIEVIPKSGYRYHPARCPVSPVIEPRRFSSRPTTAAWPVRRPG